MRPTRRSFRGSAILGGVLRRTRFFLSVLALGFVFLGPASAAISYTISLAHPEQHLFHVTMEVPEVQGEAKLQMAAWNALYEIRDFSSHVEKVEAFANGRPTAIEKLDKLTWRVKGTGTVTIQYATFWDDTGPFNSQLNSEHAFINPAMILMYVPDRRTEKITVALQDLREDWNVATATFMTVTGGGSRRLISLEANSFDALADGPIEASHFDEFTLPDISPTVRVIVHGDNYKKHDVQNTLRKIVQYETRMMDGAPYDSYTFIFHTGKAAGGSGGGMEHARCTAIFVPSGAYLANISAHEFFHLWNVKRIRPASLEPIDYTHEMYTRSLWFAEGVTNTYGAYALLRTGLWNKQDFYQDLSAQITELQSRPADQWQSAEESSLDAWLEKYALYNQPGHSVSYYTKGQVLGVLLDILIRDHTENQHSLDDVLRAMNQDFAKTGKFYRDSLDVRLTAEKITATSLADFFARYVSDAQPLPYRQLLAKAGLALDQKEIVRAALGFAVQREQNAPWTVATVDGGSPAEKSGLRVGDELLRWNNGEVPRRPDRWASQQKPGEELRLRIRREEKEQNIDFHLSEVRETFYEVLETPDADGRAKRLRDGILHGTTEPVSAHHDEH